MMYDDSPPIGGLFLLQINKSQQHERKSLRFLVANFIFQIGRNRVDFTSLHVIIKTLSVVAFYPRLFSLMAFL